MIRDRAVADLGSARILPEACAAALDRGEPNYSSPLSLHPWLSSLDVNRYFCFYNH
ncbi:hypothetical protein ACFOHW_05405 [Paenibacillus abyssi]|uniref:hypothetical protein n=1 Tax=Paenibacillus abyssi TaxID=1340531 RepID=UPI00360B0C85